MFAKVYSSGFHGMEGVLVEVETDILNGLPSFTIVGLPDKAVEESKERVRSALKNTGAELPAKRITINLAPGDVLKEGPLFDLPIAISILGASEQLKTNVDDALFIGELSLNGELRRTKGVLPLVLFAKEKEYKRVFIPEQNSAEAAIIDGLHIFPVKRLKDVILHLSGEKLISPLAHIPYSRYQKMKEYEEDFCDIRGQDFVKRAIEIAVAGGHNVILKGPPGSGKTLIARTIPTILPDLTFDEALEVTKLYSISGLLGEDAIVTTRPFRSPHHTTSHIGLIGGSANPRPGEVSLAHRGVLFLDEFPEFPRNALEALRQPLEDGEVVISRAKDRVTFPSRFMLVAATNPCPCGYFGDRTKECTCSSSQIIRYQKKLSGPLLDRIDLHIDVQAVEVTKITDEGSQGETSETVRKRIVLARVQQEKRLEPLGLHYNSEMSSRHIARRVKISLEAEKILKVAMTKLSLSARSYYKIVKISQTIADLAGSEEIEKEFVLEALQYRPKAFVGL